MIPVVDKTAAEMGMGMGMGFFGNSQEYSVPQIHRMVDTTLGSNGYIKLN